MHRQVVVSIALATIGVVCLAVAVYDERRMHRHRQPGVSYGDATLRRDGGWGRDDLFTAEGLRYQRRASAWGVSGALLLVASLLAWVLLGRVG